VSILFSKKKQQQQQQNLDPKAKMMGGSIKEARRDEIFINLFYFI
jgi:hypothetical protein